MGTGCRPAKLVGAKKKKRRTLSLDKSFDDAEIDTDADFGFDDDHDSAVADLGSENNDDGSGDDGAISDVETEVRQFDALCYEDVRLLAMQNPVAGERMCLLWRSNWLTTREPRLHL